MNNAPILTIDDFPRELRRRTVELLKQIGTLAEDRVFNTRSNPLAPEESPVILVWMDDVHGEWQGDAPRQFDSVGKLIVTGYVSGAPVEDVEDQTEQLATQIQSLLNYVAFVAPPLQRIRAIDRKFVMKVVSERYEGYVIFTFDLQWTEVFEPLLAPFTGAAPFGAYGAPLAEVQLTAQTAAGEDLIGATITLPPNQES
ncbi:MAG TPA: hypothetical protein VNC39_01635 [Acidocella sp.]|jgi:hypothetical protein|uniref:hypothetical protein n=1 Tax=Acidocella sp. TaxID=50710 RepID=UPI002D1A5743|nr:hypothetical protein [Acidocella sp.]HVE20652.1 hypothetical protein [Acidocella sp.]